MKETVLLTGATGFLGCHLLEALIAIGYDVIILKRSFSNIWRINNLLSKIKCYDVDKVSLEKPFEDNRIDTVIHTAINYGRKGEKTTEIIETNLIFPMRLLEIAISSNTDTFFNTDTLLYKYLNTYSLSKKQFVEWLRVFSESDKIQGINLKIEHMYGPKDDENKFVTWVLRQMVNGAERIPLTKGEQKRDFIYVSDVVSAYLLLLQKQSELPTFSEFEVGTGQAVSVKSFVLKLKEVVGRALEKNISTALDFGASPYRPGEFMEIKADIERLLKMGWKPKIPLNIGMQALVREALN